MRVDMCLSVNGSLLRSTQAHSWTHCAQSSMHVARQIAPHVASVNASIEQRGEQRFQPHVERSVGDMRQCKSTITLQHRKVRFRCPCVANKRFQWHAGSPLTQ